MEKALAREAEGREWLQTIMTAGVLVFCPNALAERSALARQGGYGAHNADPSEGVYS